jgi:TRAP-type C4-dicarboxylate transport system permease small subunit
MAIPLKLLRILNAILEKASVVVASAVVAVMVTALTASAATRFVSGTGYDWLIELPPALVPWLVFPLLGPLLRSGGHIQVDFLPVLLPRPWATWLKLICYSITLAGAVIFLFAGTEAVELFRRLGQLMELEIDIPIWWMYLAFPVGFAMLALFAIELIIDTIRALMAHDSAEQGETS